MSKLTYSIIPLLAVEVLLIELAHRHPIFHHGVEIVALLIALSTISLHPEGADLLLPERVVRLVGNRFHDVYHLLCF